MTLCDELLFCASVLQDGDAGPYWQQVSSRRLVRIADEVKRMEEALDGIVAQASDEAHLLRMRPQLRVVQ